MVFPGHTQLRLVYYNQYKSFILCKLLKFLSFHLTVNTLTKIIAIADLF